MDWFVIDLADQSCLSTHDTEDEAWAAIVAPEISGVGASEDLVVKHADELHDSGIVES